MEDRFKVLYNSVNNDPDYLGNTFEAFCIFYYASLDEDYLRFVQDLFVGAINNSGGLIDECIRLDDFKHVSRLVNDGIRPVSFYRELGYDSPDVLFDMLKDDGDYIGKSRYAFYIYNLASLDNDVKCRLLDLMKVALKKCHVYEDISDCYCYAVDAIRRSEKIINKNRKFRKNFHEVYKSCINNERYIGNSVPAFYMFNYASLDEEYSKRLVDFIKEAIKKSSEEGSLSENYDVELEVSTNNNLMNSIRKCNE